GSDITLTTGMTLDLADHMLTDLYNGEYVTLFTGVDRLTLNSVELDNDSVTDVTGVFNGLPTDDTYYLSYNSGDVSIFAVSYEPAPLSIPEPTTTTLSLLALAGLVARRRRS
ncbi:MAG: PEP-CTERM sorting domain-containing protein, partial [Akkermansia sp.]|nr:PEP-CTERM sorting domain-containing protein [Akkermansia sp.]